MQYLIGLDIGTTAEKIALFNTEGRMLAVSTQEYTLDTPRVNFVEVPAETYWNAFKEGVKEIRKQYVISDTDSCALAISAQGETLFCVDESGNCLRKAIVWMDNRAEK